MLLQWCSRSLGSNRNLLFYTPAERWLVHCVQLNHGARNSFRWDTAYRTRCLATYQPTVRLETFHRWPTLSYINTDYTRETSIFFVVMTVIELWLITLKLLISLQNRAVRISLNKTVRVGSTNDNYKELGVLPLNLLYKKYFISFTLKKSS